MATAVIYQRRQQKIGLTALIDVVFILLMFFMLTSTFISAQQIDMKTPVANAALQSSSSAVVALLDANGTITVNDHAINGLESRALAAFEWYADKRAVVLVPQGDVTVQAIVVALEQMAAAGISPLTLGDASNE